MKNLLVQGLFIKMTSEKNYYYRHLNQKKKAACILVNKPDIEPTRGKVLISAASLAFQCGNYREAEIMASMGLDGNSPECVLQELREIIEKCKFL